MIGSPNRRGNRISFPEDNSLESFQNADDVAVRIEPNDGKRLQQEKDGSRESILIKETSSTMVNPTSSQSKVSSGDQSFQRGETSYHSTVVYDSPASTTESQSYASPLRKATLEPSESREGKANLRLKELQAELQAMQRETLSLKGAQKREMKGRCDWMDRYLLKARREARGLDFTEAVRKSVELFRVKSSTGSLTIEEMPAVVLSTLKTFPRVIEALEMSPEVLSACVEDKAWWSCGGENVSIIEWECYLWGLCKTFCSLDWQFSEWIDETIEEGEEDIVSFLAPRAQRGPGFLSRLAVHCFHSRRVEESPPPPGLKGISFLSSLCLEVRLREGMDRGRNRAFDQEDIMDSFCPR